VEEEIKEEEEETNELYLKESDTRDN